jgi:hypothetical protein
VILPCKPGVALCDLSSQNEIEILKTKIKLYHKLLLRNTDEGKNVILPFKAGVALCDLLLSTTGIELFQCSMLSQLYSSILNTQYSAKLHRNWRYKDRGGSPAQPRTASRTNTKLEKYSRVLKHIHFQNKTLINAAIELVNIFNIYVKQD